MHTPYRRVVERVAQAEWEDAKGDDCADSGQWVSMCEGQKERDGQQPKRREAIHIRRITEERVVVALSPPCYRVDGETEARQERHAVTKRHALPCAGKRAGR